MAEDKKVALQFKALFASGVKTRTIPVAIRESVPDPAYTLKAPKRWNGRDELEIAPSISNLKEMKSQGAGELNYSWKVSGMATINESGNGKLVLQRAQNSGDLTVELALDNGGAVVSRSVRIAVVETKQDAWVKRIPSADEKPVDHQFYARDDKGRGLLHYRGTLKVPADSVFLRLYGGDKLIDTQSKKVGADKKYALSAGLQAGLTAYRTEFGIKRGGVETILEKANDLVCGDVFVIQGQSNAEAWTDQRVVHPYRSPWLRSFGTPSTNKDRARDAGLGQRPVFQRRPQSSSLPNWLLGGRARQDAYRNPQDPYLHHQWGPGRNPD